LAAQLSNGPKFLRGRQLVIEGHTDETDNAVYNYYLGHRRAEALRQLVIGAGIPPALVVTRSRSETRPLFEGVDASDQDDRLYGAAPSYSVEKGLSSIWTPSWAAQMVDGDGQVKADVSSQEVVGKLVSYRRELLAEYALSVEDIGGSDNLIGSLPPQLRGTQSIKVDPVLWTPPEYLHLVDDEGSIKSGVKAAKLIEHRKSVLHQYNRRVVPMIEDASASTTHGGVPVGVSDERSTNVQVLPDANPATAKRDAWLREAIGSRTLMTPQDVLAITLVHDQLGHDDKAKTRELGLSIKPDEVLCGCSATGPIHHP